MTMKRQYKNTERGIGSTWRKEPNPSVNTSTTDPVWIGLGSQLTVRRLYSEQATPILEKDLSRP